MKSSLPAAPVLKEMQLQMEAIHYNNVHLALGRLGVPLKLIVPGLRSFEIRLEPSAWVCYDRSLNNLPLLAWTGFHPGVRNGLYEPVPCRLLLYHPYAAVLVRSLLLDINRLLLRRMTRNDRVRAPVIALPHTDTARSSNKH